MSKMVDPDGDGTISLGDAKAAAAKSFDKLDLNPDSASINQY